MLGPEAGKKVTSHVFATSVCLILRDQVVLIHGLSIPSLIWKDVAPTLASRGYRVLLYGTRVRMFFLAHQRSISADLYGRGYSDAPEITYDTSLYATQLALLMQHIKWPKAYVAGVSMVRSVCPLCCHNRRLTLVVLFREGAFLQRSRHSSQIWLIAK